MSTPEEAQEQPVTEFRKAEDLTQEEVDLFHERGMFPGVVVGYPKNMSLPAIIADVRSCAEKAATTCPTCGGAKAGETLMIQKSQPVAVIPASNGKPNGSGKSSWGSVDGVHDINQVY